MSNINPRDFNALPPAAALAGFGFPQAGQSEIEEYDPMDQWQEDRLEEYRENIRNREKIGDIAESGTLQGIVLVLALLASPYGILYAFSFQVLAGAVVAATRKKQNRIFATGAFVGGLLLSAFVQFYPHWETDSNIDKVAAQLGETERISAGNVAALSAFGTVTGVGLLAMSKR